MGLLSVKDIHTLIEQDVHNLGFYLYDDLETEEIDLQINRQIYKIVDGILDKYFGRIPKVGVEEIFQKNIVTLDNLKKQHVKNAPTTLTTISGGISFPLQDPYYHYIKAVATVTYSCKENGETITKTLYPKIRIGESENIDTMKTHNFHKTNKKSPLGEIAGDTVYVYTDGTFTITDVKLDYIKKPAKVVYGKDVDGNYDDATSTQCDLDDSLHYLVQEMTSIRVLKILEKGQQKIENIQQETI